MRNEFAEMFQPVLRVARWLNRDGKQGSREEKWRDEREKEKKERGSEGRSSKGDRKSRSEKQASPKKGMALRWRRRC
jgi:hypothetical protein